MFAWLCGLLFRALRCASRWQLNLKVVLSEDCVSRLWVRDFVALADSGLLIFERHWWSTELSRRCRKDETGDCSVRRSVLPAISCNLVVRPSAHSKVTGLCGLCTGRSRSLLTASFKIRRSKTEQYIRRFCGPYEILNRRIPIANFRDLG